MQGVSFGSLGPWLFPFDKTLDELNEAGERSDVFLWLRGQDVGPDSLDWHGDLVDIIDIFEGIDRTPNDIWGRSNGDRARCGLTILLDSGFVFVEDS